MTLDDMLKTPGRYAVSVKGSTFFGRVEVDDSLVCHQLTPDLQRDGVLPSEGWRRERGFDIVPLTKNQHT